jgi:hypothetical protein
MDKSDQEGMKEALKESLKEWLDEKFMQFGKWSVASLAAAALAALVYFILSVHGWEKIGGH